MKKTLIGATILLTAALLLGGIYYPNSPLMWLAGTSIIYAVLRAILIIILGVLLFSNPPRAYLFRYGIGLVAVVLGVATAVCALTYKINIVDAVVFIEIAIIFGIEALEAPAEYKSVMASRQKRTFAK